MLHIRSKRRTIIEDVQKSEEKAGKNVPRLTALLSFTCGFLHMWLGVIFSWSSMSLLILLSGYSINCREKFMELSISPFKSVSTSCMHFESLLLVTYIFNIGILPHVLTLL